METYGPISAEAPQKKLKDSCNVCASLKQRCDKQKPTCSRCAKLGRPCTYSSARRMGRPHGKKSQSQVGKHSPTPQTRPKLDFPQKESLLNSGEDSNENNPWSAPISTNDSKLIDISTCNADSATKNDCTEVAIRIVEQLESSNKQVKEASDNQNNISATEACQSLLTILVCPCSDQADVALLVASACISLLDMVQRSTTTSGTDSPEVPFSAAPFEMQPGGPTNDLQILDFSQQDSYTNIWTTSTRPMMSRQVSSSSFNSIQQQQQPPSQKTQVLGDLSKIAKVVSEFSNRYAPSPSDGDDDEDKGRNVGSNTACWVVGPVAAMLRAKVQCVTGSVTRGLLV